MFNKNCETTHTNINQGILNKSHFWKKNIPWLIPCLLLFIHPLSLFGLFGIAMSQQSFGEMSFYSKTVTILGCFGLFAPLLAAIFALVFVKYWHSRRLRCVQVFLFLICLVCSVFPMKVIQRNVNSYRTKRQYVNFVQAVQNLDKNRAFSLANKIRRFTGDSCYPSSKFICLGIAYELNGEYENCLKQYQMIGNGMYSFYGRVYYKQKRYTDSFEAYCQLAELAIDQCENVSKNYSVAPKQAKAVCWKLVKQRVLFFNEEQKNSALMPFDDYDSFLNFLNRQYEQMEEPKKYERAIQFLRDAAKTDVSEFLLKDNTSGNNGKDVSYNVFYQRDDTCFYNAWNEKTL